MKRITFVLLGALVMMPVANVWASDASPAPRPDNYQGSFSGAIVYTADALDTNGDDIIDSSDNDIMFSNAIGADPTDGRFLIAGGEAASAAYPRLTQDGEIILCHAFADTNADGAVSHESDMPFLAVLNVDGSDLTPLMEPGSAAALSGLKPGDEIIAVDQTRTPTLETVRLALLEAVLDRDEVEVKVAQPDEVFRIVSLDLRPAKSKKLESGIMQHLGFTPKRPTIPPVIDRLEEGGPAAKAGLRPGDRVIAVDGEPMRDWMEWAEYIRKRPGRLLQVTVDRNGQRLQIDLVPARLESAGGAIGRIGAAPAVPQELPPAFQAEQKYSPLPAVAASVGKTWDMSALTLRMLWRMLVGQASLENLSGPISIAQVAGETAKVGAVPFLSFLAIVSISLGVLNLLPVPVLDGGHLMYYLVEIVKGRPISEHAQVIGQKIGLVLLLGLMFLAFYNDITRLLR